MIPKIVHYCWLSGDPIPEKLQVCMDTWRKFLPDYEFILWDLKRFDISQSLWVKQAYEVKKYAFAADYIRLYAVYHFGGIYMDMDVEVCKSFDPLLTHEYILGYETETGIEAGIFGGEKGAGWLKKCLDYYEHRTFIKGNSEYDVKTLPKIMFDILSEERRYFNILPSDYLTAKSYQSGKIYKTENTYTIHHFAGSWATPKQKLYRFVRKFAGEKFARFCSNMYKLLS